MKRVMSYLIKNGFNIEREYSKVTGGFTFNKNDKRFLMQGIFDGDKIIGHEIRECENWKVVCCGYSQKELIENMNKVINC